MDLIYYYINQTSLVLLNYTGSIYLNLAQNIQDIQNEYNNMIRIMNHKLFTVSIIETCNFNGFKTFDALVHNINAKSFIRILTMNNDTALKRMKIRLKTEIAPWQEKNSMQITKEYIKSKIPKNKKYDLLWRYYQSAVILQLADIQTYNHSDYDYRNNIHMYQHQYLHLLYSIRMIICRLTNIGNQMQYIS